MNRSESRTPPRSARAKSEHDHANYEVVDRGGWPVHVHKTKLVWVVEYEALERTKTDNGRPAFWAAYYAIEKRKPGAKHWAHNNKAIGQFSTLAEALAAGDAHDIGERKAA